MSRATSSTRSVMITKSLVPRISWACCATCTLTAPSSPKRELLGREHTNCTLGLKGQATKNSGPSEIKLLDFLYGNGASDSTLPSGLRERYKLAAAWAHGARLPASPRLAGSASRMEGQDEVISLSWEQIHHSLYDSSFVKR